MKKHEFFLGIGVGIIVTSIVFYLVLNSQKNLETENPFVERTKAEQPKTKDKQELELTEAPTESTNEVVVKASEGVNKEISKEKKEKQEVKEKIEVVIPVNSTAQDIAGTLFELGIINNKKTFIDLAVKNNVTRTLESGTYFFEKNSDEKNVLDSLY
ncbi:MAG: hypothetical protein ACK5LT_08825 [Lachnospirales bacterium]